MTPRLLFRERAQERDVSVAKDLEKGVVKRDNMKPDSGALDGLEESKAENQPQRESARETRDSI